MKRFLHTLWRQDDGVLSFEWVLLVTLLTIGIVSGIAAARDGIIDELGDIAQATISFDQSYTLPELEITVNGSDIVVFPEQSYTDTIAFFDDCGRVEDVTGQPPSND
jgi:Flp pilus assembly pilin Flp